MGAEVQGRAHLALQALPRRPHVHPRRPADFRHRDGGRAGQRAADYPPVERAHHRGGRARARGHDDLRRQRLRLADRRYRRAHDELHLHGNEPPRFHDRCQRARDELHLRGRRRIRNPRGMRSAAFLRRTAEDRHLPGSPHAHGELLRSGAPGAAAERLRRARVPLRLPGDGRVRDARVQSQHPLHGSGLPGSGFLGHLPGRLAHPRRHGGRHHGDPAERALLFNRVQRARGDDQQNRRAGPAHGDEGGRGEPGDGT